MVKLLQLSLLAKTQSVHMCGKDLDILLNFTYHSSMIYNNSGSSCEII